MKYLAVTAVEPEFLRIIATGEYANEDLFGFIGFIKSECKRTRRNLVLIDCGSLVGQMTEVERFEGGQKVAEVFGPAIKAALIMPSSNVTKLGEIAAVNRGARFLVTTSESEALDWLLTT